MEHEGHEPLKFLFTHEKHESTKKNSPGNISPGLFQEVMAYA